MAPRSLLGNVKKPGGQKNGRNQDLFNKKRIKTWWFRKKVVILHPLFVADDQKAVSLT
jgi:hypothetical protein